MSRIFILALDGVPYSLLQELLAQGVMPNLRALITPNSFRPIDSVMPPISSVAWSSFMTGRNPGRHGIFGFIERNPATMDVHVPTAQYQQGETIWELLSRRGKRVFTMNVPVTYPPRPVNGILIPGFLAPNLNGTTYPAEIGHELESAGYLIDVDTVKARDDIEGFAAELHTAFERRVAAMWRYFYREDWDFFMAHIMETDRLHHFLWEQWEQGHPRWAPFFIDFYRSIDKLIGQVMAELPNDMQLLLLSDHGFTRLKKEVFVNKFLFDAGYLRFNGDRPPESLHDIHPASRAYSLIPGRVYVNLAGREKNGRVAAGMEYEALRAELRAVLQSLRDPDDGAPVVRNVLTREEAYGGNSLLSGDNRLLDPRDPYYLAPDLVIDPMPGYDFKGNLWRERLTEKGPIVGTHTFDDAFLLIPACKLHGEKASITDIHATILDLLNIPPAEPGDGRSLLYK